MSQQTLLTGSINQARLLNSLIDDYFAAVIIAIVGGLLLLIGVFCYCKRKRAASNVEF